MRVFILNGRLLWETYSIKGLLNALFDVLLKKKEEPYYVRVLNLFSSRIKISISVLWSDLYFVLESQLLLPSFYKSLENLPNITIFQDHIL